MDDIFAVQDEIALRITEKLKLSLIDQIPQAVPAVPEAYSLYLQANHLRRQSTPESFEQAVDLYQQAIEIDPAFTAAWDRLAILYCMQANFGLVEQSEGYASCLDATNMALELDPNYAPAHSGLGWIEMMANSNLTAAAQHYQRALELDPTNVAIIADAAVLVQYLGRLDESIELNEYAMSRDPVNAIGHANLGLRYRYADRIDDALSHFRTALALSPDRIGAHYQIGVALLRNGEPGKARVSFRQESSEDWREMGLAMAAHAMGEQAVYEKHMQTLIDDWGDEYPSEVAQAYAWVGESDLAFEWLQRSIDQAGAGFWPDVAIDDLLKPLHTDPRWPSYAETIAAKSPGANSIPFEVTLPE